MGVSHWNLINKHDERSICIFHIIYKRRMWDWLWNLKWPNCALVKAHHSFYHGARSKSKGFLPDNGLLWILSSQPHLLFSTFARSTPQHHDLLAVQEEMSGRTWPTSAIVDTWKQAAPPKVDLFCPADHQPCHSPPHVTTSDHKTTPPPKFVRGGSLSDSLEKCNLIDHCFALHHCCMHEMMGSYVVH